MRALIPLICVSLLAATAHASEQSSVLEARLAWEVGTEDDDVLFESLSGLLRRVETDMTLFFRNLAALDVDPAGAGDGDWQRLQLGPYPSPYYRPDQLDLEYHQAAADWFARYRRRLREEGRTDAERREAMDRVNPLYVPRNYLAQEAIDAVESGDFALLRDWLEVLRRPYQAQPGREAFAARRPDWARSRAGCSMLSCSS